MKKTIKRLTNDLIGKITFTIFLTFKSFGNLTGSMNRTNVEIIKKGKTPISPTSLKRKKFNELKINTKIKPRILVLLNIKKKPITKSYISPEKVKRDIIILLLNKLLPET